jgi:hypothetical protein
MVGARQGRAEESGGGRRRWGSRLAVSPLLAAVLACAAVPLERGTPPFEVSPDGRTAAAGGESWRVPDGVAFFQRGAALHVVSLVPGRVFDVTVPLGEDGRFAWPENAPFEAAGGEIRLRATAGPASVDELIESGQLHRHDDHYHLTHRFQNEDWQALYRARADDSPLPPLRRQVAAVVLALLVDQRIPGTREEATAQAMKRVASVIGKARRAVEADLPARTIESMMAHDYEILDEGRLLTIEGQTYRAGEGVRFAYCGDHFHVESTSGHWAHPIALEADQPGHFAFPASIFFEVRQGGVVAERPVGTRWQQLADSGQIRFIRDHWHLTEGYLHPRLKLLQAAMDDPRLPETARARARGRVLDVLHLRLDLGTEAEFEARLAAIDQVIVWQWSEFEREARAGRPKAR